MKDLIISLGVDGREKYSELSKGLINSVKNIYNGKNFINFNFFPDVTLHTEIPYKFKFDLMYLAREQGVERVFWLDSTMRIKKNIFELFDQTNSGVVAFNNEGHPLDNYISDEAVLNLIKYGILDNEKCIKGMRQIWGGAIGFDFTKTIADFVFRAILDNTESFKEGTSQRAGFIAHRHDQAVISVILDFYRVKLFPYGVIASKKDVTENTYIQYGD